MTFKAVILFLIFYCSVSAQTKTLEFGKLSVKADPETGGRIISIKYDDKEFLTDKSIHPNNYGSTLWPSPQSLWNWPPPDILDSGEYEVNTDSNKIFMRSKEDHNLGLQISKSLSLSSADTSLNLMYMINNISDKEIEAAPWEITRMQKGGGQFHKD